PMSVRFTSPYINYFGQQLMGDEKHRSAILRWKIEPKKEDIKKYIAGKLVEPQKQIVYYISKNMPEKWRPYNKQ
ncbi:MAG: hypothetical protein J7497_09095, partial [Chitinophagaceae bacterium]|nr:hypothetical protein [Chitinophagaceae bacterium]